MINIRESNNIDIDVEDIILRIRKLKFDIGEIESPKIRSNLRKVVKYLGCIKNELFLAMHESKNDIIS